MDVKVWHDNSKVTKRLILGDALKYSKTNIDITNISGYNLNDNQIKDYLNYKYIKYGIIPKCIVEEHFNKENTNLNKDYYINSSVKFCDYIELTNLNILLPNRLVDNINLYMEYINNYLVTIESNIDRIHNLETYLLSKQHNYRLHKTIDYVLKYNTFSRIKEFIQYIKNDLYQDFDYLYTCFLRLKYDTLLYYEIIHLNQEFNNLVKQYEEVNIPFFLKNSNKVIKFKINKGSFDLNLLLDLIKKLIDTDLYDLLHK